MKSPIDWPRCGLACVLLTAFAMTDTHGVHADDSAIRQGPQVVSASSLGVGRLVSNLEMTDFDGRSIRLSEMINGTGEQEAAAKATVIAITGTGCPLCLKYAPSLARIEDQYKDKDVRFVFVNPNPSESRDRIDQAIKQNGFDGPYIHDVDESISTKLHAKTTTEVFVIDSARTLVYRGAVDDQYGFGYALDAPRHPYLIDAIDAVLHGQSPIVAATSSPGCELFHGDDDIGGATDTTVTYHNQIARIMQTHCVECHRGDGIAPMSLSSFDEVVDHAAMIQDVIDRGVMPPWFAADLEPSGQPDDSEHSNSKHCNSKHCNSNHSDSEPGLAKPHWANERSLSDQEKLDIAAWIKADTPEGDLGDAPLPKTFPDGWLIGKPDAVFEFDRPVPVKATGTMPYKNIVVDTDLDEGKWVQAVEIRPGNRSVVHHVIVTLTSGEIDERSGYWAAYVPGNSTRIFPKGQAKWLPAGSKLNFQMHYTPNGTATEDQTRIGLKFCETVPDHEVRVAGISNARFRIAAGDNNYPVTKDLTIPTEVKVLAFLPHMHLRGKAARYELIQGDQTEVLLDIPRYDFNWQLCYELAEPRTLHRGDVIRYTSWYDNSADNPANPDPDRVVTWGQQTEDEMHLGYVEYIVPGDKPTDRNGKQPEAPGRSVDRRSVDRRNVDGRGVGVLGDRLFKRLDVNGDGFISRREVRKRVPNDEAAAGSVFDRLDEDKDDQISRRELSNL